MNDCFRITLAIRPSGRASKTRSLILLLLLVGLSPFVLAETLRVGPGEAIGRIADAAKLAKDGDTVEIMSGEYRGDVAVWKQKFLTIRGIGKRPVLIADGKSAEGKAIWVIRNGEILVENIEFHGSRVPAGDGAGIRFQGGKLTVRNCAFIDNQIGILTSNDGISEIVIKGSHFADAPHQMHSLPHLLYVGRIAAVTVTGSRFENGYRGHLIKSRARHNEIHNNYIVDGAKGEASYEIDLPDGGIAHLTGNTIGQSAKTQNPVLISYGAETNYWPDNALTLRNNTLTSDALPRGWFLRVHEKTFSVPPRLDIGNNVTKGIGIFSPALPSANN